MIEPRIPVFPASCYGVMCEKHHNCARYAAVNGAVNAPKPMGTCSPDRKDRPGFIPMIEVKS